MFPKQIVYVLFGIIAILSVLLGYNIYSNSQKNILTEEKINRVISKFEEKIKNGSIYLTKVDKLLIDEISQHLIDSISNVYEKELETTLNKTNKSSLTSNNIKLKKHPKKRLAKSKKNTVFTNNVKSYKNIQKALIYKPSNNKTTNNVTTYSKLKSVSANTNRAPKPNITTYSKLNIPAKKALVQNTNNSSIEKRKGKKPILFSKKNTSVLSHNNQSLDLAKNINNIDRAPIFPGCENKKNKKKCFATKVSKHILSNFDSNKIQNLNLEKGIHKVRVLFIVDKNGNTKIGKLLGKWHHKIYETVKKSIESTPKMQPGIDSNKSVDVKYSLLIPFIIQ